MPAKSTKVQPGKGGKLASKKSKTNDPACSAAMSTWKTSGMTPQVAATLAKCRSMAQNRNKATQQREAGNEAKAQVLEKRADRGLSGKDRLAKARELVASRKAKIDAGIAAKAAVQAKPSLREQADAARAQKGSREDRMAGLREKAKARLHSLSDKAPDTGLADRLRASGTKSGVSKANKIDTEWRAASKNMDVVRGRLKSLGHKSAMAQQAKPSPLEQARTARAAKGDRTTRLKALAERSMAMAESRATKAGSLSGAAQDRLLDRSMAAAGRYNRLEAARTPYKPATAPAKAATPSRSTPERQAAVQAAKDRLFGKRLDRAFTQLDGAKGKNFQGLDKVRAALPYKTEEFNQRLRSQRQQGRYSLDSFEGAAGSISPSLKAAAITEGSSRLTYLSRNSAEPYTPRKASLPAIKSGLPTVKSGVPAETPKPSLYEQARIHRAAKYADRNRDGRLAARAKKQYDAARRNMKANLDKAKSLGSGQGDKYVAKATKYGKRLEVASKRFEKLNAMWATGGKFTQARVVN